MENKKYTISNISEKQLVLIAKSLDLYTRLGLLQFERAILDEISWSNYFTYTKNSNEIELKLKEIRRLLVDRPEYVNYGLSTWSLGIGNKEAPRTTDLTYEMCNDIFDVISPNRSNKGKLKLSNEDDIIVQEKNQRLEKIINILDQLNKK